MGVLLISWRAGLILCGLAVVPVCGSAFAEPLDQAPAATPAQPVAPETPRAGRYTMVPAEGGFVRLDTETGTVSHCRRGEASGGSVWTCAAIPEDVLSRPDPVVAMSGKVDDLEREVADLRDRLDDLEGRLAAPTSAPPSGDPELDRALNFSEELMSRFFGMVREMKRETNGDRT